MNIVEICVIAYLVVGVVLAFVWWINEYKVEAENEDPEEEIESSMACIFLLLLVMFWPIKLVKNWMENFIE